jgi:hypothetical protein
MEPVGVAVGRVGCCASPVSPRHVHVPVGPSSPRDPAGDVPIASPTSPLHHHIKKREERHGGMGMSNWEVTFGADGWMDGRVHAKRESCRARETAGWTLPPPLECRDQGGSGRRFAVCQCVRRIGHLHVDDTLSVVPLNLRYEEGVGYFSNLTK